jgi:serine/threonine protein phosphatase 1
MLRRVAASDWLTRPTSADIISFKPFVATRAKVHSVAMIARLFTSWQRSDLAAPRLSPGNRVYAIGDIHGCIEPLRRLHQLMREHATAQPVARNVVVYLGDYVDRGPDSRGVIDVLRDEPLPGFERIYLKGNHEASLLHFLADEQHGPQWFTYGGDATLYSYGVHAPRSATDSVGLQRAQSEFAQKLPPEHRDFFNHLRLTHIEDDYLFVHAGLRPGVPLEDQNAEDLLWIRDEFLRSDADFGKIIVHGHSISEAPTIRPNRIGIDTGAFAGGPLTCLVLEGTSRTFLTS